MPDVPSGSLRPELVAIAVPTTADGHSMNDDDFALTAGWGHFGTGEAVMPGQGRAVGASLYRLRARGAGRCRQRTG